MLWNLPIMYTVYYKCISRLRILIGLSTLGNIGHQLVMATHIYSATKWNIEIVMTITVEITNHI